MNLFQESIMGRAGAQYLVLRISDKPVNIRAFHSSKYFRSKLVILILLMDDPNHLF